MKFVEYHLKVQENGAEIVVRRVDEPEGGFVCPICGDTNHSYPPWSNGAMNGIPYFPASEDYASGSQEICRCCGMEFGCEGDPSDDGSRTMQQIWLEWRMKWLRECHWSEEAIAQLSNLGFTRDEVLGWKAKDEA